MDLLKTPHEKLMEDAGLAPQTPGMLNTPHQLLMQEIGGMQHFAAGGQMFGQNKPWAFGQNAVPAYVQGVPPPQHHADGGSTTMSPQDMLASLVASGHLPEHYLTGGTVKNVGFNSASTLPFMGEELKEIGHDISHKKYIPAALKTVAAGYSAFAPITPLTALISGMTYTEPAGEGSTIDEYNQRKAAEAAEVSARAKALSPVFKWNQPETLDEMQARVLGHPNLSLPPVK